MGVERRQHTPTFKKQVVLEILKGEKTRSEICSQFGVHRSLADKWRILVIDGMDKLFTDGMDLERKRDKELIEELYKQVGKLQTKLEWLKKRWGISSEEKIKLIEKENPELSIREQCELLQLNCSVYYYDRKPLLSLEDIEVMNAIDKLYTKRPYFGVRRITKHLDIPGVTVNHKRVHRLMQIMGIQAIYPGPKTSDPNKQHEKYPYLLKGITAGYPNHMWGTDITYIRVRGTWMYLVAILDWYSRYVLSWELSDTLCVEFCIEALKKALETAIPDIHNSDQGAQFTAEEYLAILKAYESIRISMDGRGRAMDNIFTERLWRTVKYEEVYIKKYQSPKEALLSLREYFTFYNHERKHQALHYETPETIYFNRR